MEKFHFTSYIMYTNFLSMYEKSFSVKESGTKILANLGQIFFCARFFSLFPLERLLYVTKMFLYIVII